MGQKTIPAKIYNATKCIDFLLDIYLGLDLLEKYSYGKGRLNEVYRSARMKKRLCELITGITESNGFIIKSINSKEILNGILEQFAYYNIDSRKMANIFINESLDKNNYE